MGGCMFASSEINSSNQTMIVHSPCAMLIPIPYANATTRVFFVSLFISLFSVTIHQNSCSLTCVHLNAAPFASLHGNHRIHSTVLKIVLNFEVDHLPAGY